MLTQAPITISLNGTSAVQVAFSPSLLRSRDAALRITYDGVTAVMPLTGEGQRPTNLLRYYNDVGTDLTGISGFLAVSTVCRRSRSRDIAAAQSCTG